MTLEEINTSPDISNLLKQCCGCNKWVKLMVKQMPFLSINEMMIAASESWSQCTEIDYLEAFSHHPKIGDIDSLRQKFASTAHFSAHEQVSVKNAQEKALEELKELNGVYEKKFDFIFIVCATGKTVDEMLDLLKLRIKNDRNSELKNAAHEQSKITALRINKLIKSGN